MSKIFSSLAAARFDEVLVCDNAKRAESRLPDLGPYGQFDLALQARNAVVYFQDDDVIVSDPEAIIGQWKPGFIVCNMPREYQANYAERPDRLMGFGSVFEKVLVNKTFNRYLDAGFTKDPLMRREAGRLFTCLNPVKVVDFPITHLPWATAPNRLYKQPDHGQLADAMRVRAKSVLERECECRK
jgi:hypothetical protein